MREYIGWDDWNKPRRRILDREDYQAIVDAWHDRLFKHYYGENTYQRTDFDHELPGERLAQFIIRNWTTGTLNEMTATEFIKTLSTFDHTIFDLISRRDKWEDWKSERNIRDKPKSQSIGDPYTGYTKCGQCSHLNIHHHPNWTILSERNEFNGWHCDPCGKVCTDHLGMPSTLRVYDNFKSKKFISIEEKVWEDIKRYVTKIHNYRNPGSAENILTFGLIDTIQKIDKEFCPGD